jgi:two-component system, response regulator
MKEKTILLVEDNENDVFLTKRALTKLTIPHKLVVASDGVEALNYLYNKENNIENDIPACVLLDLKLPRVDGLKVLKEIRSKDRTRMLPVLIVTSSSEESDVATANELGATSYSVKPTHALEYSDLIQMIITKCLGK